jgi:hypothetical protein
MSGIGFDQSMADSQWDNDPHNPVNFDPTSDADNMYCQECDQEFASDYIFCHMCGERMVEVNA